MLTIFGTWFRISHLSEDNLYFADEGQYIEEARFLAGYGKSVGLQYAKPVYSGILAAALHLGDNHILTAQRLQACIASLWIPLIFFFSWKLFRNEWMALLAALMTCVDPWIYFYSRHLFSDPLATLFWMLCLLCLMIRAHPMRWITISALLFGLSLGSNYRMILFLPGSLLFLFLSSEGSLKERIQIGATWLGFLCLPLLAYQWIYSFFWPEARYSYLRQLIPAILFHSGFGIRFNSLETYPALVLHYEGFLYAVFLVLGILALIRRKEKVAVYLLSSTYLLSLIGLAISYFPFARSWAPLLFWHPLLSSLGIGWMASITLQKIPKLFIPLTMGLVIGIFTGLFSHSLQLRKMKMPYSQALNWIQSRLQPPYNLVYSKPVLIGEIVPDWSLAYYLTGVIPGYNHGWEWIIELPRYGFRYVLLDDFQFVWPEHSMKIIKEPLASSLYTQCKPLKSFFCESSRDFWQAVAWEHNVSLRETKSFIHQNDLGEKPCLEIFDLRTCPRLPATVSPTTN